MCVLSINVMLCDHLEALLRFWLKRSSSSTGFIRVSAARFWLLRNLVFVSFISLSDMMECHVDFIYRRNAFWLFPMILVVFFSFNSRSPHAKCSFSATVWSCGGRPSIKQTVPDVPWPLGRSYGPPGPPNIDFSQMIFPDINVC